MKGGKALQGLISKAKEDEDILAVVLFGSAARGEAQAGSDLDVCLLLYPRRESPERQLASRKLMEYLEYAAELDLHLFQLLPLYIRHRVLKEGKVLYCRDEDKLYELAFRTAQVFEDFKHLYREYLEEVARARS